MVLDGFALVLIENNEVWEKDLDEKVGENTNPREWVLFYHLQVPNGAF